MKTPFISVLIFIYPIIFVQPLHAQVSTSETFEKVVRRLVQENAKQKILETFDPMSGIIGADLVDQIVESADKTEIIKSVIDVSFTMVYLYVVQDEVEELSQKYPEVKKQAYNQGLSEDEFIGYSSLYFYFSERIKYGLFVSPEINRLSLEQEIISKLQLSDTTKKNITKSEKPDSIKWVTLISKTLVKKRRDEKKYIYDVRLNEFLRYSVNILLFERENSQVLLNNAWQNTLSKYSKGEREAILKLTNLTEPTSIQIDQISNKLIEMYTRALNAKNINPGSFEVQLFYSLAPVLRNSYLNPEDLQNNIYKIAVIVIESLADKYAKEGCSPEYKVSIAGSVFTELKDSKTTRLDFTVLDQFRYQIPIGKSKLFLYIGGFIDPILKNTFYKDGAKVYLSGMGFQTRRVFLSVNIGIPYPDYKPENLKIGMTMGYEIPYKMLFDK